MPQFNDQFFIDHIQYSEPDTLHLFSCDFTDANIPALMEFLKHHPEIKSLNLAFNRITEVGAQALATCTTLTSLSLH